MQSNQNIFAALWKFKGFRIFMVVLTSLIILAGATWFVFAKVLSTDTIDYPKVDHLHFRMQYIYHGNEVSLADPKYQVPYEKNQCTGGITDAPIHLHDNVDQIVHVHWQGLTGGQVLKYYGVNYIGGLDSILGYRFDELKNNPPQFVSVPVFTNSLPKPESGDQLYVYSGDKDNFTKRSTDDWLHQTLETFFGQKSLLSTGDLNQNILGGVLVNAATTDTTTTTSTTAQPTEEELKQINNFIGNVVIFVQKDEPTNDQVKQRFDNLVPLPLSTCGG
jgi:hypothetical protein